MGQSYRIRTELGVNKTLNLQLDQDFEFLEILSLKIQQSDIYNRNCADYGVVVGRVTANNGFGIPNARVSIFIPINSVDESNPLISSIYPYKSVTDRNEDGYRYNLLPYEKSYSSHAATGTLPSRLDVLTGNTTIEIYDKYYKFTAKTNESGDYMIMGVPLGDQFIFMDLDLSDMGEFSLTPQDLIRMGLATEAQVNGNTFKTSSDLNSLPQIVSVSRNIEISPLWGDESLCQIAINRMDFDLRDDFNIDIQPTAVFMGSIYSTDDNFRIRRNGRIRDDFGNLCGLQAGPGQIIALRQTIFQDSGGNPIIERYELEQNGNLIDGDGTWVLELPMNLDYYVTNEFGEKVLSNDPSVGIPTKSKYRFKIKWQQSQNLTEEVRRPYYLVPNIREYGWNSFIGTDPNNLANPPLPLKSSYYFGLDWSGYTQGFSGQARINRLNEIINCEDTFYQFEYNRVYTVAGLIDEFKNGNRGSFVGIKEINDNTCAQTINKFPVNEGFRNFDLTFFVYAILLQVLQLIGPILITVYHIMGVIYNFCVEFRREVVTGLGVISGLWLLLAGLLAFNVIGGGPAQAIAAFAQAIKWGLIAYALDQILSWAVNRTWPVLKLPSLTYPSCTACECSGDSTFEGLGASLFSLFTPFSRNSNYVDKIQTVPPATNQLIAPTADDSYILSLSFSQAVGTNLFSQPTNSGISNFPTTSYKTTKSITSALPSGSRQLFSYSDYLPMAERVNLFNTRQNYFNAKGGINRISVSFDNPHNSSLQHLDNTLTVFLTQRFSAGTMITFVTPSRSQDPNFKTTSYATQTGFPAGISGTPLNPNASSYTVEYCDPNNQLQSAAPIIYNLYTGSSLNNYSYPADIEYYQVLTSMTVTEAATLWPSNTGIYFPSLVNSSTSWRYVLRSGTGPWFTNPTPVPEYRIRDLYANFDNQYITILQRGVDPYSPLFVNKYGVGKIFGYPNENDLTITAQTRINIPIQKLTDPTCSVQKFNNQNNIFYSSHFFRPGTQFSAFTTSAVGYYSSLASDNQAFAGQTFGWNLSVINGVESLISQPTNSFYLQPSPSQNRAFSSYQSNEDVSGAAFYWLKLNNPPSGSNPPDNVITWYYTKVLLPNFTGSTPFQITSPTKNLFRNDRLPSSDALDGNDWNDNPSLLQQNLAFSFYTIEDLGTGTITTSSVSVGADIITPDITDQYASLNVIDSFECENLVDLNCYSGNGVNFGIIPNCPFSGNVVNGCYVMAKELSIRQIQKDIDNFNEWAYRYRFFFGLCRGVLAQSFTNNWVNGSLFMFPIQVNRRYNSQNLPEPPRFSRQMIYFDSDTNNFYYRSSPYFTGNTINPFIGRPRTTEVSPTNERNLLFPTTIINLGMKDEVYKEIILDPGTNAYVMRTLAPTSYSDTSDLINMFVISRITDETFLQRYLGPASNGNNSLNQLFNRYPQSEFRRQRLDADITQLLSINSELGVIPFSPQFYTVTGQVGDPVVILGSLQNPTMGVFFSSTTVDLQNKDFITPGRLNIRTNPNTNAITYDFGIKSQVVPFYQWGLKQPTGSNPVPSIFGSQTNNWVTNYDTNPVLSGIKFFPYQSLDRRRSTSPNYFVNRTTFPDTRQRGYIFSNSPTGAYDYQPFPAMKTQFMVGAPFHFYFGIIKGQTALDKFKTKYLPND